MTHVCVMCNDVFGTERDLKIHLVAEHGAILDRSPSDDQGRPNQSAPSRRAVSKAKAQCIVLPKNNAWSAQQRPTLYKCLTCKLGFTKVNDLLMHCAQMHGEEPRLEIAIDYNKQTDHSQGENLMEFIRLPEAVSEMESQRRQPSMSQSNHSAPNQGIPTPPVNGHNPDYDNEDSYQQYEEHAPPHYEPLTPNGQQQARLPSLAPSKPNAPFSSPPRKRSKKNSGKGDFQMNGGDGFYEDTSNEVSTESHHPLMNGELAPLVNGKIADGHMCDVCGKTFKRVKDKKQHMKLHGMTQDLRCHECMIDFTWDWTLALHLQHAHNIAEPPEPPMIPTDIFKPGEEEIFEQIVALQDPGVQHSSLHHNGEYYSDENSSAAQTPHSNQYAYQVNALAEIPPSDDHSSRGQSQTQPGNYSTDHPIPLPPKKRQAKQHQEYHQTEHFEQYQQESQYPYEGEIPEQYTTAPSMMPRQPMQPPNSLPSQISPAISSTSSKAGSERTKKPKPQCPFCAKELSRKRDLNRHIQNVHMKGNTGSSKQANKLQCHECNLYFVRSDHLEEHKCLGRQYTLDDLALDAGTVSTPTQKPARSKSNSNDRGGAPPVPGHEDAYGNHHPEYQADTHGQQPPYGGQIDSGQYEQNPITEYIPTSKEEYHPEEYRQEYVEEPEDEYTQEQFQREMYERHFGRHEEDNRQYYQEAPVPVSRGLMQKSQIKVPHY